ncbi:dienelactone hydrolase family protein [Paenibacillus thermotolerans]|uniref:dienelactone hydrolase family protein n=1 Tax=Paenibacillus thermotolerans TaxID=3027807 RepID=UPI002367BEEF|nr:MULTISPECIES: alpha/beta fold hydrolase [unclassified Paenibacillus]
MNIADKEARRQELYGLLGDLPDRNVITANKIDEEVHESYTLERLQLDLNGMETVPAYFAKPRRAEGPTPVVLFNHSHGGNYQLGKDELIKSNVYMYKKPYAEELAALGFASFCIDMWGFGERRGRTESEIFKEMLWNGRVMWGMMVYDNLRAIDYLASRDDVIADRIATLGMSMGSTMAWWTAALDPRVKVCVDICCLTDFHSLIESRGLDGHGIYYYVPALLKHFTTSEINALISPRCHLSTAGNYDLLTPPAGLDIVDKQLQEVYLRDGAPDNWKLLRYNVAHLETAEMRNEIVRFLAERL